MKEELKKVIAQFLEETEDWYDMEHPQYANKYIKRKPDFQDFIDWLDITQ